jgi:hypothetical protein
MKVDHEKQMWTFNEHTLRIKTSIKNINLTMI